VHTLVPGLTAGTGPLPSTFHAQLSGPLGTARALLSLSTSCASLPSNLLPRRPASRARRMHRKKQRRSANAAHTAPGARTVPVRSTAQISARIGSISRRLSSRRCLRRTQRACNTAGQPHLNGPARVSETLAGGGPLTCWLSLHSTSLPSAAASEKENSRWPLLRSTPFHSSKPAREKRARATSFCSRLRSQIRIGQDLRQDQN
jgi:hypothetical protein